MAKKFPPIHPDEILREELLVPLKLTLSAVAVALHAPRTWIERIAREEKPVTADTALRLGKFFKNGAAFWTNGGYVSARIAKHDELLNGALSSILCVGGGMYAVISGLAADDLWMHLVFLPLSPALGALGGFLRARQHGGTVN